MFTYFLHSSETHYTQSEIFISIFSVRCLPPFEPANSPVSKVLLLFKYVLFLSCLMFYESLAFVCTGHLGDIKGEAVVCSPLPEEGAIRRHATGEGGLQWKIIWLLVFPGSSCPQSVLIPLWLREDLQITVLHKMQRFWAEEEDFIQIQLPNWIG